MDDMLQKYTAGRIVRCGGVAFAAAGASLLGASVAPRPPLFFRRGGGFRPHKTEAVFGKSFDKGILFSGNVVNVR